jgi:hypothetical protein
VELQAAVKLTEAGGGRTAYDHSRIARHFMGLIVGVRSKRDSRSSAPLSASGEDPTLSDRPGGGSIIARMAFSRRPFSYEEGGRQPLLGSAWLGNQPASGSIALLLKRNSKASALSTPVRVKSPRTLTSRLVRGSKMKRTRS